MNLEIHYRYEPKQQLVELIDKHTFAIHEFTESRNPRLIHEFAKTIIFKYSGPMTYKTTLNDVVELVANNSDSTSSDWGKYSLLINGLIIYNRYIKDMDELVRLESTYK